jgi:predicted nucleic acid-binding protein
VTSSVTTELSRLIRSNEALMIGSVRQELLSGVRERDHFLRLRKLFRQFGDFPHIIEDYEQAAEFHNRCRAAGITGSPTDFLICAAAARLDCSIFSTDQDFVHYARVLPISRHGVS